MHGRWSTKVALPVGKEWGHTTSVADCMVWKTNTSAPDKYLKTLGKPKRYAPAATEISEPLRYVERCEPNGDFYHGNDTAAARINHTKLRFRPPTPPQPSARHCSGNHADGMTSYYVDTELDGKLSTRRADKLTSYRNTGRTDTNRSVQAQIRARSVTGVPYTDYSHPLDSTQENYQRYARDDDAELIASFLEARDGETYEKAKRELYEQTYQRQLEDERARLHAQRMQEYDAHVRAHSGRPSTLNDRALTEALQKHVRTASAAGKPPPVPRPPSGVMSEHRDAYRNPGAFERKTVCPPGMVENLRIKVQPDENVALQNLHRAALNHSLLHAPEFDSSHNQLASTYGAKPKKRVCFQSRPNSASNAYAHNKRSEHFFQWRDATQQPPPDPRTLWKSKRYQSAQPRIDNRWAVDPSCGIKPREDGKIQVDLTCPDGEEMNVNLRVEANPTRTGLIYG